MIRRPLLALSLVIAATGCTSPPQNQGAAAADPAAVCTHIAGIAAAQVGVDANKIASVEPDCLAAFAGLAERQATLSTCLLAATDPKSVSSCEKGMPPWVPLLAKASTIPQGVDVCDHVIGLVREEMPQAAEMPLEEMDAMREKCVTEFDAERERQGDEAFAVQAKCIMESNALADFEKCGLPG